MAEQLICNQQGVGSTPITSSRLRRSNPAEECLHTGGNDGSDKIVIIEYGGIPEWPKGADCKSVVSDFGGPNPPSPTSKKLLLSKDKRSFLNDVASARLMKE